MEIKFRHTYCKKVRYFLHIDRKQCHWTRRPLRNHFIDFLGLFAAEISHRNISIGIMAWISNHIYTNKWHVMSHPCTQQFNGGMMTSSNGNIFRVTGPLCGEFTGHWWIPLTKASDTELWCFLLSCLNKRLSKQAWGWWFETTSRALWRHCNGLAELPMKLRLWWIITFHKKIMGAVTFPCPNLSCSMQKISKLHGI